jgi:anti-sigma factor RsiW
LTTSAVGIAEVTHESVRGQLSDYMANSLPEGERARVSEHLLRCADCRAYRATIRATSDALSRLPVEKAPAPSKRRLREIPDGLGHEE